LPWKEAKKAFDGSAVIGDFFAKEQFSSREKSLLLNY
jgi:2-keto-4-pentenoate hydratase/2-oxohepta-3-ene-1,7-dioic acid hydratase in catechol pathway